MNLLRSLLHAAWACLTVVPYALATLLAAPFVRPETLYRIAMGWLPHVTGRRALALLGIRLELRGMENLPAGGAVLLVKHQSTLETLLMPVVMPRPLAFVFKKELLSIPFFGWAMARLDMVHIDRSQRSQAFARVVARGRELLAKGIWVTMFPEGTRIPRWQRGQYKNGGTRLAVEAGAPVVPIAITSARVWPRKAFVKRPGLVVLSVGPPIDSTDKRPEALMREVEDWIEAEMARLDPPARG